MRLGIWEYLTWKLPLGLSGTSYQIKGVAWIILGNWVLKLNGREGCNWKAGPSEGFHLSGSP